MDNFVRDFSIALFGAIVGGFIVGFFMARVERRLAAASSWYRARSDASRAKREGIVAVLAANPPLLTVAYLDALVGVVFLTAAFICFVQLRGMIEMSERWAGDFILVLTTALLLMLLAYRVSQRISVAQDAWRRIAQANGLPKRW